MHSELLSQLFSLDLVILNERIAVMRLMVDTPTGRAGYLQRAHTFLVWETAS